MSPRAPRRPQINFQVDPAMKVLYDEASLNGHRVTRLCAAGLLLMIEDPVIRHRALLRLRDWETEFADADEEQVREFVQGAEAAMTAGLQESQRGRKAQPRRKTAK